MQFDEYDAPVRALIHRALKAKLLSKEEEVRLAVAMNEGTRRERKAARDKLVESHLKLAIQEARRYSFTGVPIEDLINQGTIGLMQAAKKFEVERGFRFNTYARWWVRESVKLYARSQGKVIRVPESRAKKIRLMNTWIKRLSTDDYVPTDEEVAEAMGESVEEVRNLAVYALNPVSLNTPISEDGETEWLDFVEDENGVDVVAVIEESELSEAIAKALECLNDKQRYVIVKRFGLDGEDEQTLEEVSQTLKVTRERVRQIQVKALEKLGKGTAGAILSACR